MIYLVVPICLYVLLLLAVTWLSVRPPRIPIYLSPGAWEIPFENLAFQTADGVTLKGWWMAPPKPCAIAIFSHGYMMNRCELTPVAASLYRRGFACMVYDARAHGKSSGKSGVGYLERLDVMAAVEEARRRLPTLKVVLIGSSMGSVASALALGEHESLADALVLDSAYSKLPSASLGWWRFVGGPVLAALFAPTILLAWPISGFNPFRVDVAEALYKIKAPVLFFHGDHDDLALPREAIRNFESCENNAEIVWFKDCGHSEGRWLQPELYLDSLLSFLGRNKIGN